MPPPIEPQLTGLFVRELRGHHNSITSLSKIKYSDCSALLSASKDCLVKLWTTNLDLCGQIDQKKDDPDPLWQCVTQEKYRARQVEL